MLKAVQVGSRTGAPVCSMATTAITKYYFQKTTKRETFVYIDDFICGEHESMHAWNSYMGLIKLFFALGVDLSYKKCIP